MLASQTSVLSAQPARLGWLLAALLAAGSLSPALAAPASPAQPADTVLRAGVRGQVINQQKQPLEFATVLLRRAGDSTLVSSSLSDEQGRFQFGQLAAGRYYVHVKQLGYRDGRSAVVQVVAGAPGLRLAPLVLAAAAQVLAEVQVTGRRPPIERQIDRMVVHVDQLPTAAGGSGWWANGR